MYLAKVCDFQEQMDGTGFVPFLYNQLYTCS